MSVAAAMFEAMERRAWDEAAAMVDPTAQIHWPVTDETFNGESFFAMNRAYPEGWSIQVVESMAGADREMVRVRVAHDGAVFWCLGSYDVSGGVITGATEYWVEEASESAPDWRAPFRVP